MQNVKKTLGWAATQRGNRTLIVLTTILGGGWAMSLYYEREFWKAFSNAATQDPAKAFEQFVWLFLAGMLGGAFAIRRRTCGPMTTGALAVGLAMNALLISVPGINVGYALSGAMGLASGIGFMGMIFLLIHAFGPGSRLIPLMLEIGGLFAIEAALSALSPILPPGAVSGTLLVILAAATIASSGISERWFDLGQAKSLKDLDPVATGLFGLYLLIAYFANYYVHELCGSPAEYLSPTEAWLVAWAPRFASYAILFAFRRRVDIFIVGYLTIGLTAVQAALGFTFGLHSAPFFGSLSLMEGPAEIFLFVLLFDIARKHDDRPWALLILIAILAVGNAGGTLLGSYFATGLGPAAGDGPGRLWFYLVLNTLLLGILPYLLRRSAGGAMASATIPTGASGSAQDSKGSKDDGFPATAATAEAAALDAFVAIDERYQGEFRLTPREKEILALLVERYDYRTISERLGISVNTLKVHVRHVYEKCDVSSRRDLIDAAGPLLRGR